MKGVPRVPKKNPKHQAQLQRQQVLTKRGKRIYNWRKIGIGLGICGIAGVFVILGIVYGPQVFGRQVKDGDSVYIYYKLTLANGTVQDQSKPEGLLFSNFQRGSVIDGFYENVIGMREGTSKSFTIPACPSHDCPDYKGYAGTRDDPAVDWQELNFFVTIKGFA